MWFWLLASVCFLGVLAAQVVAVPALAPVTATPAVEPLPTPTVTAPSTLAGAIDNLPVLVSSFPADATSASSAAAVARANVMDAPEELGAFDGIWTRLTVSNATLFNNFRVFLLTAPDVLNSPAQATVFPQWSALVTPSFTLDTYNAGRLTDAAVALFMLAIAQNQGRPTTAHLTTTEQLALDSEWLLLLTQRAFAGTFAAHPELGRPAVIDLAWELSTGLGPGLDPLIGNASAAGNPVDILQSWLKRFPNDAAARYLLGHVLADGRQSSSANASTPFSPDSGLQAALAVLDPLAGGRTAALADSAVGDAYFSAARQVPDSQPYHAASFVRAALSAYDRALAINTDPALYAARARALKYLGNLDDARAAASRAVDLSHNAAEAEVLLAAIDETRGDFTDMRDEARIAAREAANSSALTIDNVRFLTVDAPPYDSGDGGYSGGTSVRDDLFAGSYGSLSPHITAWSLVPPQLGAAGALIGIQIPPTRDPKFDRERDQSLLPDQAAQLAMQASVVLGDTAGADSDYAAWNTAMRDQHLSGSQFDQLTTRIARMRLFDLAAHAPTQYKDTEAINADVRRDTILRRAKRFSQDVSDWQAVLPSITDANDRETAVQYLAEAQYLDKQHSAARDTLMAIYDQETKVNYAGDFFNDVIAIDLSLHRYGDAAATVHVAATSLDTGQDTNGTTAEDLGEIALVQGHAGAAASYFRTAVTQFRANTYGPLNADSIGAPDYLLEQSDLGTALLQSLQPMPGAAPDCATHADTCRAAASAYMAALIIDPDNAVVLMNLGWTQRLLGDTSAERTSLEHAVAADPTLFPALNDLGVLYAQSDDAARATTMFERAIAANPTYDLATWNLGVLDMEDVTKLPRAQALLATAAQLNPDLRGEGLDYKTDERIYTVAFQRGAAPPFTTAYSIGVVVLGSTGIVSLLVLVFLEFTKERGREFAVTGLHRWRRPWSRIWNAVPRAVRMGIGSWQTTVIALLLGTVLVTVWANSADQLSLAAIAVFAAVTGIVVHEAGHVVASRALKREVESATAPGGIALALLMIPFRLIGGPYLGHEVVTKAPEAVVDDDRAHRAFLRRNVLVYLAGPLANALVLAACLVVFLFQPVPALKVVLLVQLGIISFSLLPLKPMEGATLTEEHPWLVGIALFALVVLGVVYAQGVL